MVLLLASEFLPVQMQAEQRKTKASVLPVARAAFDSESVHPLMPQETVPDPKDGEIVRIKGFLTKVGSLRQRLAGVLVCP